MRRLLPTHRDDLDLDAVFDRSERIGRSGRPWLMANMIMSVDGAFALDGRSGGMGSAADHQMFHALRAACDAIFVAAGTARQEGYRRPSTTDEDLAARRAAAGMGDAPALYLASRALDLPADMPLRSGAGGTPTVLYPSGADTAGVDADGIALRAVPVEPGGIGIDLSAALESIAADGHRVVLCEGGPSLLGALQRHALLDELFVSYSPVIAGGPQLGLMGRGPLEATPVRLTSLYEADGMLLADYLIEHPAG
ncbi:MAG: dihydrofolate reductase family protein [Actinomycetota bacterium]|nr:dihydrofolate reductase family protein [Actinomycetota bacterium]